MDDIEGDMISGDFERTEPEGVNIAQMVDQAISVMGFEAAIEFAEDCSENASFPEDREDWADVLRAIKERQDEMAKNE